MVVVLTVVAVNLVGCGKQSYDIKPGYTTVVFKYNGAEGMANEEIRYIENDTDFDLPSDLIRSGYGFLGWKHNKVLIKDNWNTGKNDVLIFEAKYSNDYADLNMECAVKPHNEDFIEFKVGEYADVDIRIDKVIMGAGYKATFYTKKNFKGKSYEVCYRGDLNKDIQSLKVETIDTEFTEYNHLLTDDDYAQLLTTYAPKIWWDVNEVFFGSTVEKAKENLTRTDTGDGYFYQIEGLSDPYYMNDFLKGDKDNAKLYSFAVRKEGIYLSLVYFVYTPYNYGKDIAGHAYGNHIGDWEHISVNLIIEENNSTTKVRPAFLEISYHEWREYYDWNDVEMEGNHPVVYIALKSHGIWNREGVNVYKNIYITRLKDECSKGYAWDSWNTLETFVYDALTWEGRGVGSSTWKTCFDKDYLNKDSDAVMIWGNYELPNGVFYRFLVTGPTGPQEKEALYDYYAVNSAQIYEL